MNQNWKHPGRVAQSVACLGYRCVSDCRSRGCKFDPGPVPYLNDHEMISEAVLLSSANSFKKGFCQLQAKVCARITG